MKFWNGQPMQSRFNWDTYDLGCSLKAYRESLSSRYYPRKKGGKNGMGLGRRKKQNETLCL